jgi:hypothetical protein
MPPRATCANASNGNETIAAWVTNIYRSTSVLLLSYNAMVPFAFTIFCLAAFQPSHPPAIRRIPRDPPGHRFGFIRLCHLLSHSVSCLARQIRRSYTHAWQNLNPGYPNFCRGEACFISTCLRMVIVNFYSKWTVLIYWVDTCIVCLLCPILRFGGSSTDPGFA